MPRDVELFCLKVRQPSSDASNPNVTQEAENTTTLHGQKDGGNTEALPGTSRSRKVLGQRVDASIVGDGFGHHEMSQR